MYWHFVCAFLLLACVGAGVGLGYYVYFWQNPNEYTPAAKRFVRYSILEQKRIALIIAEHLKANVYIFSLKDEFYKNVSVATYQTFRYTKTETGKFAVLSVAAHKSFASDNQYVAYNEPPYCQDSDGVYVEAPK